MYELTKAFGNQQRAAHAHVRVTGSVHVDGWYGERLKKSKLIFFFHQVVKSRAHVLLVYDVIVGDLTTEILYLVTNKIS